MASVKWLRSIEIVDHKFKGYAMISYSYTKQQFDHDLKQPVQEIRPRAMMVEPGIPRFYTRKRCVEKGIVPITGRAWVGGGFHRSIAKVEISFDDGDTWHECELCDRMDTFSWHKWTYSWDATTPGDYIIVCRATDTEGNVQKKDIDDWNYHGMADDGAQRVEVEVVDRIVTWYN